MARTNELCQGLAWDADQFFLERQAFVSREDGIAHADDPVPVANDGRNVGRLVTLRLPFPQGSAEPLEGFIEEGGNEMGLKTASLGPFHVFPNLPDAGGIHGVVRQGVFLNQIAEFVPIQGVVDDLVQLCSHFRTVSVPNGLHEEVPQGLVAEKQFAEDVEYLSAQRLTFLLQLLQQTAIHIAFPRL